MNIENVILKMIDLVTVFHSYVALWN